MQQNKIHIHFIPIDPTKMKTIARIALGIYILFMLVVFNAYSFNTIIRKETSMKTNEVIFSYFAIYGTIFCFYARTFLYCSVLAMEKHVLYKILMLLHQVVCAGFFLAIVVQMLQDTTGRFYVHNLGVFNDYELLFTYMFIIQWMGYLIGISAKRIVINVIKFIAEKDAASFILIILSAICIIIGFFVIRFIVGDFAYQIKSLRHLVEMDLH